VTINTYFKSPSYYMEDISRKIGTFDMRNGTSSVYRFTDADNIWNTSTQRAGVDAHYGAAKTYDYFLNAHGRRGIDGAGGPALYTSADGVTGLISSKVHYSSGYNNAFWNGNSMTYGDGNGSTFSPLVTLDICGHEMTHGITERTARLTYSGESGALNESMSDVFGAMVERSAQGQTSNTWKIGEQCYTPSVGGDALRYMDNPHSASNSGYTADDDPDHYAERYTGTGDSGGVHINSGIGNKAFYLVAVGGTHHRGGSVTGIGADAAAKIWYRALTTYMTSSTNFKGARTATLNAAAALYGSGSANYNAVAQAWTVCGVL
jgi:thermolysin